jgi:hypothetical protein
MSLAEALPGICPAKVDIEAVNRALVSSASGKRGTFIGSFLPGGVGVSDQGLAIKGLAIKAG